MTSYAQGRDELATALESAGVRVDAAYGGEPPYAVVFSAGVADFGHVVMGRVPWQYRAVMVAGGIDGEGVAAELDALRASCIGAARTLAGWRLERLDPDGIRDLAGGRVWTADLIVSRHIDL